jgi:hypothetical protein
VGDGGKRRGMNTPTALHVQFDGSVDGEDDRQRIRFVVRLDKMAINTNQIFRQSVPAK